MTLQAHSGARWHHAPLSGGVSASSLRPLLGLRRRRRLPAPLLREPEHVLLRQPIDDPGTRVANANSVPAPEADPRDPAIPPHLWFALSAAARPGMRNAFRRFAGADFFEGTTSRTPLFGDSGNPPCWPESVLEEAGHAGKAQRVASWTRGEHAAVAPPGITIDEIDTEGPHGASIGRAVYEVLRLDKSGKVRRLYMRRRDLIRQFDLLPRDLRRIDPTLSVTRTSPTLMPREKVILVNVAGVRLIITATTTLVFEPQSQSSQRFIQAVLPRLSRDLPPHGHASDQGSHPWDAQHHAGDGNRSEDRDSPPTPFELDMIEGALLVATSKLDAELAGVYTKVQDVLSRLPAETTPINLEALRRTKSSLVELEGRAETLVQLLEEVLDDVDELRDFNLSSRPIREEKRRQRERERLERERDSRRQQETERAGRERGREEGAEGRVAYADGDYDGQYDGFSNVDDAIQELEDAEIEEQELEEVEDLLEYYLQRVASTQSEAERLLAGARDMEESISVSLSARRLAVVRLELMLSIGSFAAAIGAVISGIFGMNLKSKFEESIAGFYGVTFGIILGCAVVCYSLWRFAKKRRIL